MEANMPLAILFRAVAAPGDRERVLEFLKRDSHETSSEPGALRFDVLRDPDSDDAFLVFEVYRDEAAFRKHQEGRAFQEWNERIMPKLASFKIIFRGEPEALLTNRTGTAFDTKPLPAKPVAIAPDGSAVRILLRLGAGSMAHFELPANQVSKAVTHKTVEEIWYFVGGRGQMWRKQGSDVKIVDVFPGVSLTIPLGTHFQFRSTSNEPLCAVGVTMPPWPGEGEALVVQGEWTPTVG